MEIKNFIGTSGYYYFHWKGIFYPEDLSSTKFLKYYTQYFDTLELNSTFYHIPKESTIKQWKNNVPEKFIISIKANKNITHIKRLKNAETEINEFMRKIALLQEKLGVILFQLPPSLKKDLTILKDFINLLNTGKMKFAIEFRHDSWLDDSVYEVLKEKNIAFCISDSPYYPFAEEITADFTYIRFHGHESLYASNYSNADLKSYAEKIKKWNGKGISSFCYFNNDFGGFAVKNALYLRELVKNLQHE
jgi:uncharacterized protein YecE (DUF72 family)